MANLAADQKKEETNQTNKKEYFPNLFHLFGAIPQNLAQNGA